MISDTETVRCHKCGSFVPKKSAFGIKFMGPMSWTCQPCILAGRVDEDFQAIGSFVTDTVKRVYGEEEE